MNIQEKLLAVQSELKAPKGQFNNFGKYAYRSCEDILEAVKPLLKEHNASLTINDEIVLVGDRYYIKATAKIFDIEGEISTTAYAREEESKKGMDSSQITGSASSYARKYALNGLFCIDDTKDSDSTNKHGKDENKPTKLDKNKLDMLNKLADESKTDKQGLCKFYKVNSLSDLSVEQFTHAVSVLKKKEKLAKEVTE